ncbi:MAG: UDP-2,4-diacetamido-2,4,6-trideoxy-beta-L-altropyranose hydrolase [Acidobacteriia bacterium]|nr:UDP-2,4-diacetamido-2,4,6-trideoxy-beta-L-altropyranose hydrolase [Terriglobia bacterium]
MIRADASIKIGTGHVMRCLALAQAWQDAGGQAVFVMAEAPSAIEDRLRAEKVLIEPLQAAQGTTEDADQTSRLARKHAAVWVVVDGYHFGAEYQRNVKDAGVKLLFVDDNGHAGVYCADLVLNQNAHASEDYYRDRSPQTRLLLGPRYALLRREFAAWRNWQRTVPPVGRRVLVTMGGSDPDNVTLKVIEALNAVHVEGLETAVVMGGANPNVALIEEAIKGSAYPIRLVKNTTKMAELMAWADIAVAGAGSTCWEICSLGLPSILLVLVEHQEPVAKTVEAAHAGLSLGWSWRSGTSTIAGAVRDLLQDVRQRERMAERARGLVDGCGAERVISVLAAH